MNGTPAASSYSATFILKPGAGAACHPHPGPLPEGKGRFPDPPAVNQQKSRNLK